MDEEKNIENKIKESFSSLNKSAPLNLWNKLSDKLPINDSDANIDSKIKEGFENLNKSAPTQIWHSVNKQLNIDKVWKKISKELDRRPIVIFWRKITGVAALLLLLLGGSFYMIKNNYSASAFSQQIQGPQKSKQITKPDVSRLTRPFISADKIKKDIASKSTSVQTKNVHSEMRSETGNTQVKKSPQKSNIPSLNISTVTISIEKSNEDFSPNLSSAEGDTLSFTTLVPIQINLTDTASASELIPQSLSLFDNTLKEPVVKKKRFEIGITYSYNNTWLINNNTRSSFDENSLIQTAPAYAASYGLIANYNIFKSSALSTEFYINSKYVQKYDEFSDGKFNNRTVEFNYYKLTLLYQYNIPQPYNTIPSKYTFKGGVYGASLKSYKSGINQATLSESDKYTTTDYGIRCAIGQEKTIRKIIIVGYGLNAEYGLKNIFKGNKQMPNNFNVTKNALIGAYVNLKYCF